MIAVVPSGLVAAMAQLEEDATTYILGTQDEACIAVWSMSSMRSVSEMLPSGLGTLGVIHVVPTPLDETTLRTQLASKLHDLSTTTYALVYESETKSLHMFPSSSEEPLIPVTVVATPGHCASPFTAAIEYGIVRCFATLDIAWTRDGRDRSMAARSAIDERVAMLSAPEAMYFELPSGDIASRAGDVVHTSSRGKRSAWSLSEIVRPKPRAKKAQRANDGWDDAPKKSQPVASTHVASEDVRYGRVCYMELLTSMTPSTGTAPVITSSFRDRLSITVDVVCCLPTRSPLALVLQTLANRLTDQLCESMKHLQPETQQLRCHQFPLRNGAMHPIAVWSVDGHEVPPSSRDHLHGLFYQPLHPTFLPAGAWSLSRTQPPPDVLLNVHVGISVSKGAGGTQFLVSGDYAFYHYMQQGVNDKGWGCAYRSLQTLASWLVLNHYTSVPVPTHREIQETLVHIGDKPPRFLGSSDWIGSIEVGFVLDERYGITFRSLYCASGADLASRAHDLALHFETQGTPVMMGGASMAYTLLGVDIHAVTGDVAFLVLDPHYTGPDEVVTIQTKTVSLEGFKGVACGWRKPTAFAPRSFYNFCLPQRPVLH